MTKRDRERVKAKLIELRIWGIEEEGDPTTDADAARKIEQRATTIFGVQMSGFDDSSAVKDQLLINSVTVSRDGKMMFKAICNTYAEAVCRVASQLGEV